MNLLWENIGLHAFRVLGPFRALQLWIVVLFNLVEILKSRSLVPLDKAMRFVHKQRIQHRLGSFDIPIRHIDTVIQEGSYCFGSIRELYIRDCYFRWHNVRQGEMMIVMDLGANRGMFSTLATSFAQKIVAVEANPKYRLVFEENMRLNGFTDFSLFNAFIGQESVPDGSVLSVEDVMHKSGCDRIDFLKIDVEGAEFDLFGTLPFARIRRLSMEVHPKKGDPDRLIDALVRHGFEVICTDNRFQRTNNTACIDYIYATNMNFS
jgi:hypothetical protein